ncbi:hypothetical protein H310_02085 [Aphanomyces invadans]|uniref:Uncharacterized protein n=1 Tax=Aphanomyces invadans TaxID=157072 RepID=A0A024UMS2_9STRA|nr:hypothetical protein H310_02085 [Aphanomyces invadans]ETW07609.1 hypothetical protein H310_02085 [Aphanomyces invadans]|eukprot:XP_008863702.1 hypothetical protein H310_02085 [Aphanomyces invadans]
MKVGQREGDLPEKVNASEEVLDDHAIGRGGIVAVKVVTIEGAVDRTLLGMNCADVVGKTNIPLVDEDSPLASKGLKEFAIVVDCQVMLILG